MKFFTTLLLSIYLLTNSCNNNPKQTIPLTPSVKKDSSIISNTKEVVNNLLVKQKDVHDLVKKTMKEDYNPDDSLDITIDFIMGKFDPAQNKRFTVIDQKYTQKKNIYIDTQTYSAFIRMFNDAKKDGFRLVIISATRNFDYQKRVWENKWKSLPDTMSDFNKTLKILKFSSMPGSSRHHWGTELDLNVLENSYFETGKGKKILDWMNANAYKYGFCHAYNAGRSTGYHEERWHWSYLPLSRKYYNYVRDYMKDEYISGFKGDKFAKILKVKENYMLSVNSECID